MNLTKDAYLEIAKAADDKTIVKMLSVNRKFHDDEFFKLVFEYKYPFLIKFKKDKESWKDFYLRMVMYIAKLKKEYDIDYIPSPRFNPEEFYFNRFDDKHQDLYDAAEYLVGVEDFEFLENFLMKHAKYLDFGYLILKEMTYNNLERIKLLIDVDIKANKIYPLYSPAIMTAIKNENIEALKILILPNIREYDLEDFVEYARQNNKPLCEKYLLSRVKRL